MLMKPDKKKGMAALILGSASGPMDDMKASNEELTEAPQMDEGLLAAAEEMITAFESKDVQSLSQALKSFIEMCGPSADSSADESSY